MNDIRIYTAELPGKIRAFTVRKDDDYSIVINAILSREQQLKECRHELAHIANGDYDSLSPVDLIELRAHEVAV